MQCNIRTCQERFRLKTQNKEEAPAPKLGVCMKTRECQWTSDLFHTQLICLFWWVGCQPSCWYWRSAWTLDWNIGINMLRVLGIGVDDHTDCFWTTFTEECHTCNAMISFRFDHDWSTESSFFFLFVMYYSRILTIPPLLNKTRRGCIGIESKRRSLNVLILLKGWPISELKHWGNFIL